MLVKRLKSGYLSIKLNKIFINRKSDNFCGDLFVHILVNASWSYYNCDAFLRKYTVGVAYHATQIHFLLHYYILKCGFGQVNGTCSIRQAPLKRRLRLHRYCRIIRRGEQCSPASKPYIVWYSLKFSIRQTASLPQSSKDASSLIWVSQNLSNQYTPNY